MNHFKIFYLIYFIIYCTKHLFYQNHSYLLFELITIHNLILKPTYVILDPLTELKNWIPAPIPHYTPPQIYPVTKVNDLSPIPDSCINDSNPEPPTVINFLADALVFKNGNIATSTFFYKNVIKIPFTDKLDPIHEFTTDKYEIIEQAIPFFHPYLRCYYHFLIEMFPLLLIYDQKTIENSVLLHNSLPKNHFNELISILNLKFKRTLCVGNPVFVKKLFIPIPHPFDHCHINAVRHFRYLIFKKYNAEDLEATQNVYYNRPRNRLILNFDELKKELKNKLPDVKFITPTENNIKEQVIFWRKTKFAMAVHGSIAVNTVFMHQNTAYLEFCIRQCRSAYIRLCKSLGIHLFEMKFRNHCPNRSMYADIPEVISTVKLILKMLETQNLKL